MGFMGFFERRRAGAPKAREISGKAQVFPSADANFVGGSGKWQKLSFFIENLPREGDNPVREGDTCPSSKRGFGQAPAGKARDAGTCWNETCFPERYRIFREGWYVSCLVVSFGGKASRTSMNTNKISDASLRQTPGAALESVGVADETAQREFRRLYHQDPSETDPPETSRDKPKWPPGEERKEAAPPPDGEENRDESLASLMRGLFTEHLGAPSAEAHAAPASADSADSAALHSAERVERLVEQILVSSPDQAGDREVRLMVRNSVLPDTEIRLSRGTDGLLSVTLATGRHDAFQTLVAAQAELKQALDARETQGVRLVVADTRDADAEEGRSDKRSRGYTRFPGADDGTVW